MMVVVPANLAEKFHGPANGRYETFASNKGQQLSVLRYEIENAKADFIVQTGLNEPKEKYSELYGDLVTRGFNVHAMDWPYQGFSEGAPDHRRRHTNGIDSDVKDFARFVDYVRATRTSKDKPVVLMGHSYGAHVITQYVGDKDHKADGVFLTAPMFDFNFFQETNISALSGWGEPLYRLAKILSALKGDDAYAPGGMAWSPTFRELRKHVYSNDPEREPINNLWALSNPPVQVGGVTLKWVMDAIEGCRKLHAMSFDHLRIPFMVAVADGEVISQNDAMYELASRVPNGEAITIKDCLHEIWVCDDKSRHKALFHVDKMMKTLGVS